MEQDQIIEAFNLMWGSHPSPIMLINKKHDILALNKTAKELGIPTGIKCHSIGSPEGHKRNCGAATAFKAGQGVRKVCYIPETNSVSDCYWLPVGENHMVHFGNDITEYVKPELLGGTAETKV